MKSLHSRGLFLPHCVYVYCIVVTPPLKSVIISGYYKNIACGTELAYIQNGFRYSIVSHIRNGYNDYGETV